MTADEILAQAQAAAQDARDLVTAKPNKTKVISAVSIITYNIMI